ncbi:MAG: ribonuclease HII [Brevinema sp.]
MSLTIKDDLFIIRQYYPDFLEYLVGTDEAGRGPIAGPLVVAGVLFDLETFIEDVMDSKKISETKRYNLENLIKQQALAYHIEIVPLTKIQDLNIYQASKWGMIECFKEIQKKVSVSTLLTDAMKITPYELPEIKIISLVKGDQKSFHIAAASILAKVARDRLMRELAQQFPHYGWEQNKGYPTKKHREAIQQYGITSHHRKEFKLL